MSKYIYPYLLINNHIIAIINGYKVLVDTGSPISIGEIELEIGERTYIFKKNYYNITIKSITQQTGFEFDGLLGCDIINNYDIFFDNFAKRVIFYNNFCDKLPNNIKTTDFKGVPIIPLKCNNEEFLFFFDTGSWLSYFDDIEDKNFKKAEIFEDFYPTKGSFKTPVFEALYNICNRDINSKTGIFPPFLKKMMELSRVQGVLGINFFFNYNIFYSFNKKSFSIV
jgi:hypothetical protein